MAKKSVINRNLKRQKLALSQKEKRKTLRATSIDESLSWEERQEASNKLHALSANGSATRVVNRCQITGRGRGVYRKFGLSRIKFRELALEGKLPGVTKSSW